MYWKKEIGDILKKRKILIILSLVIIFFVAFIVYFLSQGSEIKDQSIDIMKSIPIINQTKSIKKIVCLDPGHGGKDVGANYGNIYEANINLQVALATKSILEREGYKVYLTRDDDSTVAKRARAVYCNSVKADILVSIHHNSYQTDHSVDYGTALYYKGSDQLLSSSILTSLSEKLDLKNQGIAKFNNSLLWIANMPAALSEAFFITSRSESSLLSKTDSTRLTTEAEGIADGITKYFDHPELVKILISDEPLQIDRTDLGD